MVDTTIDIKKWILNLVDTTSDIWEWADQGIDDFLMTSRASIGEIGERWEG